MPHTDDTTSNEQSARVDDITDQATSYVDRFVNYAKANPVETALATAGVAFVAGAVFLGPRLLRRRNTDMHKMLEAASRQARRVRSDAPSIRQVSDWVKAQLPT